MDIFNFLDFLKNLSVDNDFREVDNEHYVLEVDVDENTVENDVRVYVENRTLIIQYYNKDDNKESSAIYKETLPGDADENKVKARLVNGKLQVTVNKKSMEKIQF